MAQSTCESVQMPLGGKELRGAAAGDVRGPRIDGILEHA